MLAGSVGWGEPGYATAQEELGSDEDTRTIPKPLPKAIAAELGAEVLIQAWSPAAV